MSSERRSLKVFLSYASQDKPAVRELYDALKLEGWIEPWLDKVKILPGQDWQIVIEQAVEEADVVLICLSNQSVSKEGYVQREIRYAYDVALGKPEGTIFLIPVRLDDCLIPRKLRSFQWVDYFGSSKNNAYRSLLDALKLRYEQKLRLAKKERTQPSRPEQTLAKNAVGGNAEPIKTHKPAQGNSRAASAGTVPQKENLQKTTEQAAALKKAEQDQKQRARKVDTAIMAALIGVFGTIAATLLTIYANRQPPALTVTPTTTFTVTAPTATDLPSPTATYTPTTPSATFAPKTPTVTVIPPVVTVTPFPLGKDWLAGCISTLWKPYPARIPVIEKSNGCWKEPLHVFSAENGDLDFLARVKSAPVEIYGLFAALPEQGTVTMRIRLTDLSNADLWIGVFAEADINSQGVLMIIPSGVVKKRVFVQKDPFTYKSIASTKVLDQEQDNGFTISFSFKENSAKALVIPNVFATSSVSIPSSQKWLFLGYKGLGGSYRIEGRFFRFELK